MQNHYEILGVPASASQSEIRRAYRILARRYHPDVNPEHAGGERFKAISEAYGVLSDTTTRARYDADLASTKQQSQFNKYKAYTDQARQEFRARSRHAAAEAARRESTTKGTQTNQRRPSTSSAAKKAPDYGKAFGDLKKRITSIKPSELADQVKKSLRSVFYVEPANEGNAKASPDAKRKKTTPQGTPDTVNASEASVTSVSIMEVSITMQEAIVGVRKTVEIEEKKGSRKVSVQIPAGARNGTLVRLRNKQEAREELVLIIRVAPHPFIRISNRGLIVEIPVSIQEAIFGASISVPGIHDSLMVKIPPGSQSGFEVRAREKGIKNSRGEKGDIFYRIMVQVPDSIHAVGLRESVDVLEKYYGGRTRRDLPKSLVSNQE